jgi:hypothetical protein
MTIHELKAPCWAVSPPLPRDDGDPHYDTRDEALAAIREAWDEDRERVRGLVATALERAWWREFRFRLSRWRPGAPRPRPLPACCWVVQDDGDCGQVIDEEDEGYAVHCASRRAAEDLARSYEWAYSADGRFVYCPCCAPEDSEPVPPSPAEQEAAGQLVLPGVA